MTAQWQVLAFHPAHDSLDGVLNSHADGQFRIERCFSANDCLASLGQANWDLVLIPAEVEGKQEAADFIQHLRWQGYRGPVVVLSEVHHVGQVTRALKKGAMDYLLLPFEQRHLEQLVVRTAQMSEQSHQVVAESEQSRQLFQLAQRVAQTDASVLINGESGTGKEVLAQFIHRSSNRSNGPFVAINCAAIPETMIEAILFGHTKGAFTGAASAQAGKLELANGGTLFLDEIGELPLALQTKLLRVLQEREVERLGSHQKVDLNIRILAATNKTLEQEVEAGRFRADLFYRLNVFPMTCTPLRERRDDIVPLAIHLLKSHLPSGKTTFTDAAKQTLREYDWPGNARELDNVVQRALVMSRGCLIREEELMLPVAPKAKQSMAVQEPGRQPVSAALSASQSKPSLQQSRKLAEFDTIIATLRRFNGHRSKTAEELGVTTRALRYKIQTMREQGLDVEQLLAAPSSSYDCNTLN